MSDQNPPLPKNPYVGPYPIQAGQPFFGRKLETAELRQSRDRSPYRPVAFSFRRWQDFSHPGWADARDGAPKLPGAAHSPPESYAPAE